MKGFKKGNIMGLDTTHGCWHGAYSAFHRWRKTIAFTAGLPPLDLMEGFFEYGDNFSGCFTLLKHNPDTMLREAIERDVIQYLPIQWECLKPSPLHILLRHSDCEGEIESKDCGPLADALEELLPELPEGDDKGHIGNWRDKTRGFIEGLRAAAEAGENVEFH